VLVSLEALENLPDLYDAQITQVSFVPPVSDDNPGDFAPVGGGKYMPSVDLVNRIAEARGISGMDMSVVEPLYEDIDWNIMTRNDKDTPKLVRYLVGYRCTKQGRVLAEDGTDRISDPCTVNYNAWERVCELFAKEEMYSEGYTKQGKYPFKYDTMLKRRSAFAAEMKFAERKADSKARNVVVRTLCGMPTGYDAKDLKDGYFAFGKIVRSTWAMKSEHAARLQAMARGAGDHTASKALFGPATPAPAPTPEPERNVTPPPAEDTASLVDQALQPEPPKPLTGSFVKSALESYAKGGLIPDALKGTCDNRVKWLTNQTAPESTAFWGKAVSTLESVESAIPEEMRIKR
jgi:hypothetical protein